MIAKACLMLVLCSAGAGIGLLLALPPAGLCLSGAPGHGLWMNGGMVLGGLVALLCLAASERRHGASWRRAIAPKRRLFLRGLPSGRTQRSGTCPRAW